MRISSRVKGIHESITLKLNAKAQSMAESGKEIYNLTAGQLPFPPHKEFIAKVQEELKDLRSFQYSPVPGTTELRKKLIKDFEQTRKTKLPEKHDCLIANGGKHVLSNLLATLIEPGDEVILMAPYWVSYPEMVRLYKGVPIVAKSDSTTGFIPSLSEIKKALSAKTKAIILNSPNNPSGIHYPDSWMQEFAQLMKAWPEVAIISDEIYFHVSYFDPAPTYYYQSHPELLDQTIIVDGISKSFASTGLRLGHCIAPEKIIKAMIKLQGQTTSGPNTLIQRALMSFDFSHLESFLNPIKIHLRRNADILRDALQEKGLESLWYQPVSAFYFLLDFGQSPCFQKYLSDQNSQDHSVKICEDLLDQQGVALVPGEAFGIANTARLSLVLPPEKFSIACQKMVHFLMEH